jgi:hypothetical protein
MKTITVRGKQQLIKRGSKGRFESHLFKNTYDRSEVVALLIGILLFEAVFMIYLLNI